VSVAAPTVARTVAELRHELTVRRATLSARATDRTGALLGFVPTMGYLHDGHAALVRRARAECALVVASIFVNPLQFGAGEDFSTYPRDLDRDLAILAADGTDVVFVPEANEFYPDGASTAVQVGGVAQPLEGAFRPGHFRGVATVVAMLFNAVLPDVAYFGEKDWQQLQVVRRMVLDLHIPVEITAVPTVREPDGLAMSSRNVRLSVEDRARARCVPRALDAARARFHAGERAPAALEVAMREVLAAEPAVVTDYAVVVDGESLQPTTAAGESSRALVAVRLGGVRLIDNAPLAGAPLSSADRG
jgi:pantoate--beta-alanine ligase